MKRPQVLKWKDLKNTENFYGANGRKLPSRM